MRSTDSPLPHIRILPASPDKSLPEPYSPFHPVDLEEEDEDGYRSTYLSPPFIAPTEFRSPRHSSPLRPPDCPIAKGLDREQFDSLLKASRERKVALGSRKTPDLRRELAIKNQRTKAVERRALFLSKVREPPSPTAVKTPKTPPESPVLLHCSLPSPGLASPLQAFESATNDREHALEDALQHSWVEQVDFRVPKEGQPKPGQAVKSKPPARPAKSTKGLPSLEQITARLGANTRPPDKHSDQGSLPSRLPAFLRAPSPPNASSPAPSKPRATLSIGRLQLPVRPLAVDLRQPAVSRSCSPPLASPQAPLTPNLEVTTTFVPRTARYATHALTESNLQALGRSYTAKDMLTTLGRRMASPPPGVALSAEEKRKAKRHSAPAQLQTRGRSGFDHAVLSMPGGF
ncbi:hypothetical protein BV22DRAFT_1012365 [Leucogyrophana mollusca]|uniref:Uncharacterized protein n=1 Tax=Leucogyrophana mollusca TaxID=85980 RepID=A0ACB8BI67_9AGAM|nr:hypothetical protein BV22DRAFT_1012365 [Leucogyrophana mollusca]